MTIPPHLNIGDTIALITPSSPMQSGRLELAIQYFESKGFKVKTLYSCISFRACFKSDFWVDWEYSSLSDKL
jgi:muramoyltetrapeptide carboxypeptidase LdcA involved in peptidoglycan recycling